jgi:hypothetical protein
MESYFYRINRESNGHKMVKGTCLATPQRKTGTPRRLGPGSPRRMAVSGAELGGTPGGDSAREPATVASWPSGWRRTTKGVGPVCQRGRGREAGWAGLSRPGGQGLRGVGGCGPTEGQGPGGWAKNRRWAQTQKEIPFEF